MLDTKLKNNEELEFKNEEKQKKGLKNLIRTGVCFSVAAMCIFMLQYGRFQQEAASYYTSPFEEEVYINNLYHSSYVLYKDLYHKVTGNNVDYLQLYYPKLQEELQVEQSGEEAIDEEEYNATLDRIQDEIASRAQQYEKELKSEVQYLDYQIKDNITGKQITNTESNMDDVAEYYFYLRMTYDENGYISDLVTNGQNEEKLRKLAAEAGREKVYFGEGLQEYNQEAPKNCVITYGVSHTVWQQIKNDELENEIWEGRGYSYYYIYYRTGMSEWLNMLCFMLLLIAFLIPYKEKVPDRKYLCIPLEVVIVSWYILCSYTNVAFEQSIETITGKSAAIFSSRLGLNSTAGMLMSYLWNGVCLFIFFMAFYYLGTCVREIREKGIKQYIKSRSLIYRFFPFIKSKCKELYHYLLFDLDLNQNTKRTITKIVSINAIVLMLFCCTWFMGIMGVLIYSVLLYLFMHKYLNDLKKKYNILLVAINEIAKGNLHVSIEEKLGIFEPFKPQIDKIQEGFRNAVEEEVKSQRMRTELITNVSHDLKTPLTAIITYVDLLKDDTITEEQRKEYLDTLDNKSQRLKVLIEDLFEVSKANSNNVTLNIVNVDIVNLIKQVRLELSDKLEEAHLDIRIHAVEDKIILPLDSQKTYRIYENLMNNVAKYALAGTRVYIDILKQEEDVVVICKNISAAEISVKPEELTERFVRGDASRNTEGSGLGLAIAKSFTQLQNGKMEIETDGDLFKVTTIWRRMKVGDEITNEVSRYDS